MVAPMYGPSMPPPEPDETTTRDDKRRQIQEKFVTRAREARMEGNKMFKAENQDLVAAKEQYSHAMYMLEKVPPEMGQKDMIKVLSNRSKVLYKLGEMRLAEADASKALLMDCADDAATASLLLARYHARCGMGKMHEATYDLRESCKLGNKEALREYRALERSRQDANGASNGDNRDAGHHGGSDCSSGGAQMSKISDEKHGSQVPRSGISPQGRNSVVGSSALNTGDGTRAGGSGAQRAQEGTVAAPVARSGLKLKARFNAQIGTELVFGGARVPSPWGKRATPEVTHPFHHQSKNSGSREESAEVGDGSISSSGTSVAKVPDVNRRRRRRPDSSETNTTTLAPSTLVTTSFHHLSAPASTNSDTFPPPHPALAHEAVKRCLRGTDEGGGNGKDDDNVSAAAASHSGVSDVCMGCHEEDKSPGIDDGARTTPSGGRARSDSRDSTRRSRSRSKNGHGQGVDVGKQGVTRGVYSSTSKDRTRYKRGATRNHDPAGSKGSGCEPPPPARQAQSIQWLVSDATAKPGEDDVWAVLDRQWWLRWQKYTGCDEAAKAATAATVAGDLEGFSSKSSEACDTKGESCMEGTAAAASEPKSPYNARAGGGVDISDGRQKSPSSGKGSIVGMGEKSDVCKYGNGLSSCGDDDRDKEGVRGDRKTSAECANYAGQSLPEVDEDDNSRPASARSRADSKVERGTCEPSAKRRDHDDSVVSNKSDSKELTANENPSSDEDNDGEPGRDQNGVRNGDGNSRVSRREMMQRQLATRDFVKAKDDAASPERRGKGGASVARSNGSGCAPEGSKMDGEEGWGEKKQRCDSDPAPPPGPIVNNPVAMKADAPGTFPGSGRRLRMRLVRGHHFVLVPQEAWRALHAWYGGGPALPRRLVKVKDSDTGEVVIEPQLYPEFSCLDPALREITPSFISRMRSQSSSESPMRRRSQSPSGHPIGKTRGLLSPPASSEILSLDSSPKAREFENGHMYSANGSDSARSGGSGVDVDALMKEDDSEKDGRHSAVNGCILRPANGSGDGGGKDPDFPKGEVDAMMPSAGRTRVSVGEEESKAIENKCGEAGGMGGGDRNMDTNGRVSEGGVEYGEVNHGRDYDRSGASPAGGKQKAGATKLRGDMEVDGSGEEKKERSSDRRPMGPCPACPQPTKQKCGRCLEGPSAVHYCSRDCQKAHWRFHRKFCGRQNARAALSLAKRGKAGLTNLGNTCFLSSAVQCLSHVQPLTQHILNNSFLKDVNTHNPLGTGGSLVQEYEQVLKELWFGSSSTVSPIGLKNAIGRFAPQFNGFAQQDCQEVLSFLLDGLHEDLNRVQTKPYLTLPDGECGRPDALIAAECWEMLRKRDRSVLVDNLYGQFKSTLECPQCGKLSRKFDEFNVMPVELLAGRRLNILVDFAPLLRTPDPARAGGKIDAEESGGIPSTAHILFGGDKEGRKPRRVGVVLPQDATVGELKEELARMFRVSVDALLMVVVPTKGKMFYSVMSDAAEVWRFMDTLEITAHECVPGMRHALVVNRVFEGGRHVAHYPEGPDGRYKDLDNRAAVWERWAWEVEQLKSLRHRDKDSAFVISFPQDVSCVGLMELVWTYMRDFVLLTEEECEGAYLGSHLARSGSIKLSEAGYDLDGRRHTMSEKQLYTRENVDARNGVIANDMGRFIPPNEELPAAAVLDTCGGGKGQELNLLRLDWSGRLLEKMDVNRIDEPYGAQNHPSVEEGDRQVKRVNLSDCLEKFSVPETLCEDNSWYCSNCKELRQAVKTIQVWTLPQVLILHFKRFSHVGPTRGKVELFVDFPIDGLDMSPYCRGESLEGGRPMPAVYDLFAVSNHMGGMGHGHYTAFVRDWQGNGMAKQWYVCDDQDCRPVPEDRVRTPHAYVLFYRRRPLT